MNFLIYAAGIAFAFGLVIFVHEFGHFIVAKKSGVKVERFSFGLGPEMFGFQWGETRYCIAWLPLGGEVRMAGEFTEEDGKRGIEPGSESAKNDPDVARHFFSQPWYRRVLIALAGPFMNYMLALVIFFSMLMVWGEPVQINKTEVGDVVAGKPAAAAGILKGDNIVSIAGEKVEDFQEIRDKISAHAGQAIEIKLMRAGEEKTLSLTPDPATKKVGIAQAEPVAEKHKVSMVAAAKKSVLQCWIISTNTIYYLWKKISEHEKPDVAGPLGIGQVIIKEMKAGAENFFFLIAMISVAIGLFNLFPIPLLDGGHMFYYIVEGIRGKPLSANVMGKANMVGMAFLLGLLAFATVNDVQRLRQPKQPVPAASPSPAK